MIVIDVEQGSPEWFEVRNAIPTGSEFSKIITSTGNASTQADTYMDRILAQIITGKSIQAFERTEYMERGVELEAEAADNYAFLYDVEPQKAGFFVHDDKIAGASPDRLIGDDGLLEIKCPAAHTHVSYLIKNDIDSAYIPQVQGQLWLTERKWCDWFSYHPDMKPVCVRVYRDEEYIAKLEAAIRKFMDKLNAKKQILIERGIIA